MNYLIYSVYWVRHNNASGFHQTVNYFFFNAGIKESVWISGNDNAVNNTFKWLSTGEEMQYTNWLAGEPNRDNNDHCVKFGTTGSWLDEKCSLSRYFVCEKDTECPASIAVDFKKTPI